MPGAELIQPMPSALPPVVRPDEDDIPLGEQEEVKLWLAKIAKDKEKFDPDFKLMRQAMEFVYGYQWEGQDRLDTDQYTVNMTLRMVNQKVANLYARNPQVEIKREERMDYVLWDGNLTELQNCFQRVEQGMMTGTAVPQDIALIQDWYTADIRKAMIDRICDSAQKVIMKQINNHHPEFKEQLKQMVRRVIISRVGYIKVRLCRNDYDEKILSTVTQPNDVRYRMDRARSIAEQIEDGTVSNDGAQAEEIKSLLNSIASSPDDSYIGQYLEYDFPSSLSIIPSSRTRSIKEWIASDYITQMYQVPLSTVNALFDLNIQPGGQIREVGCETDSMPPSGIEKGQGRAELIRDPIVYLYEVFNHEQKNHFFVLEGYRGYIVAPEPLYPEVSGFWNIFALTFNDTETLVDGKASCFPPSDVELMMNAQREWNRTQDARRDSRNASLPRYMCRKGLLSAEDMEAIRECKPNHIAELIGVLPESKLSEIFMAFPTQPIDEKLYETLPMATDMQMAVGMQEANFGPAPSNVTATVGTIAEQSRLTVSSSNVDDLDGLLTRVARASFELVVRGMSPETVKRIAGPGAAWPTLDLEDYLNEIVVKIKAASSGRPNQAIKQQQKQILAPLLMQAGANPFGIIKWLARDMEDELNIEELLPIQPADVSAMAQTMATGTAQMGNQGQPTQPGAAQAVTAEKNSPPKVGRPQPTQPTY